MDFAWSEQQRELLDAVGRFAREQLNYNVIENDREGVFNHEAWKKCGDFGMQGLLVPTEYGGLGQDPLTTVAALERLGYACKDNGLLFSINAHMWTAVHPARLQRHRGTKAEVPAWSLQRHIDRRERHERTEQRLGRLQPRYHRHPKGDKYILNGSKIFVTNGPIADVLVVFANGGQIAGPGRNHARFWSRRVRPVWMPRTRSRRWECARRRWPRCFSKTARCRRKIFSARKGAARFCSPAP